MLTMGWSTFLRCSETTQVLVNVLVNFVFKTQSQHGLEVITMHLAETGGRPPAALLSSLMHGIRVLGKAWAAMCCFSISGRKIYYAWMFRPFHTYFHEGGREDTDQPLTITSGLKGL